jgi:hypothetical protein
MNNWTSTRFKGYAAACDHVAALPPDGLRAALALLGRDAPESEDELRPAALRALSGAFDTATAAPVPFEGEPTLFDRDPAAMGVVRAVLAETERQTAGPEPQVVRGSLAFPDHDEMHRRETLTWAAREIAVKASDLADASELWMLVRACHAVREPFWSEGPVDAADLLEDALVARGVPDCGRDELRFIPWKIGFLPRAEFEEHLRVHGPEQTAVLDAAGDYNTRLSNQPFGPFSLEAARRFYRRSVAAGLPLPTARYHDWREVERLVAREARAAGLPPPKAEPRKEPMAAAAAAHPITGGDAGKREAFFRAERESGHSPYGYWFSPEGETFPMSGPQEHAVWIDKRIGGGGLARRAAFAAGWVSMTMWSEWSADAGVAMGEGAPCARALKAAARVVRRGGDFPAVTVEVMSAADDATPASWQRFHDDVRPKAAFGRAAAWIEELALAAPEPGEPSAGARP